MTARHSISLQALFDQHDPEIVEYSIAPLISQIDPHGVGGPVSFPIHSENAAQATTATIELTWDLADLEQRSPGVTRHADAHRRGKTVIREHVTELAAYGLAFAAMSCLLPGRRVVAMNFYAAPDLIFDETVGSIAGVEVAGRVGVSIEALRSIGLGPKAKGGRARRGKEGKKHGLRRNPEVREAFLSLWSFGGTNVALWMKVKP